jgi:hypothetical protein
MTSTITSAAPQCSDSAPFAAQFDRPLPRGVRAHADEMSRDTFFATYARTSGPLRLGHWTCIDAERPATRIGPQARNYQATLAVGDRIGTCTAAASGPVAALTEMLYERGIALEMMGFHQLHAGEQTATFIHGCDGARSEWAMGWANDPTESALRAVIACANRLISGAGTDDPQS